MAKKPSEDLADYSDFELMYPGRYLKGVELRAAGKPVTLTIDRIDPRHELEGKKGDKEFKPVMFFKETEKALVLNKTNATSCGACFGRNPNTWPGKRLVLIPEKVKVGRESKEAVRIDEDATKAILNAPAAEAVQA